MATLQLTHLNYSVDVLWSWRGPAVHRTARVVKQIKSRVYAAELGPVLDQPAQVVAIKMASGLEVTEMEREAEFYEKDLKSLQGTVVPRFFGHFRGTSHGLKVACILIEFCVGPPMIDAFEAKRLMMLAACRLHQAGVLHGDLTDGRHFICMGSGVRIVDFTTAVRHKCSNGIPLLFHESGRRPIGCPELRRLERKLAA